MGDEPYAALLPWIAFAVVDRVQGDGPLAASIAGVIAALTLVVTSRRERSHNVVALGALAWFGALTVMSASHGWVATLLDHDGRAVSALGLTAIAFGSLLFTPAFQHYTCVHVRPARRAEPAFRAVNAALTRAWGWAFAGIAVCHALAASIPAHAVGTVLNWIVPVALAVLAADRSRVLWEEFVDDDPHAPDPLHDLSLDWEPPAPE